MGQSTTMWKETQLFVANESMVAITRPDPYNAAVPVLEVDISSGSRATIDAECKAQYGVPPPTIAWYIDEPTNLIDASFSTDRVLSDGTVTSTVRFDLDQQM